MFAERGARPRLPVPAVLFRGISSSLPLLHARPSQMTAFVASLSMHDCIAPNADGRRLAD